MDNGKKDTKENREMDAKKESSAEMTDAASKVEKENAESETFMDLKEGEKKADATSAKTQLTKYQLGVLMYLQLTKRGQRVHSRAKLGEELGGVKKETIKYAFYKLYERKYIDVVPRNERSNIETTEDPNDLSVTRAGKKALRPLLASIGPLEAILLSLFSIIAGVLFGLIAAAQSPSGWAIAAVLSVLVLGAVAALVSLESNRLDKERKEKLLAFLSKEE